MTDSQQAEVLKEDGLGRVLLVHAATGSHIRREVCGGSWPGSRLLARYLLHRERRTLARLHNLAGIPTLLDDGNPTDRATVLLRSWIPGTALWAATELPANFFDLLAELVAEVHARGVCHNDLHKENNILVCPDGRPALIDFQVATIHRRRGAWFRHSSREDLRHIEKHRLRYQRQGAVARHEQPRRSGIAAAWAKFGQPGWRWIRRKTGNHRGENRRPRTGPWPTLTAPIGGSRPVTARTATLHTKPPATRDRA